MRTLRFLSLVLFSVLVFASCSSPLTISTDYDRSVDFTKYKTFGIYKGNEKAQTTISELNRNRVYSAVKTALTEKGLTESENPDVWVNILASVNSQKMISSTTTYTGMGMGGYYRPYMWGGGMGMVSGNTQYDVNTIKEGSLMVDIIDGKSNDLVWQSSGSHEIDKNFGNNADVKIQEYVTQIFSTFPPSPIVNTKVKAKK